MRTSRCTSPHFEGIALLTPPPWLLTEWLKPHNAQPATLAFAFSIPFGASSPRLAWRHKRVSLAKAPSKGDDC